MQAQESHWNTASAGTVPDTSSGELAALGEHAAACDRRRGRLFSIRCAHESVQAFLASRFVTTVSVVALVIGVSLFFA